MIKIASREGTPPSAGKTPGVNGSSLQHCAQIAQLVEHLTENQGVRGSNPRLGTTQLLESIASEQATKTGGFSHF